MPNPMSKKSQPLSQDEEFLRVCAGLLQAQQSIVALTAKINDQQAVIAKLEENHRRIANVVGAQLVGEAKSKSNASAIVDRMNARLSGHIGGAA